MQSQYCEGIGWAGLCEDDVQALDQPERGYSKHGDGMISLPVMSRFSEREIVGKTSAFNRAFLRCWRSVDKEIFRFRFAHCFFEVLLFDALASVVSDELRN